MSLLIAVILIIILLSIKRTDSIKKSEADRKVEEEWNFRQNFRKHYTDLDFESKILSFIENPQNADSVDQEIEKAISEMKYQNRNHNSLTSQEKLDIFLANRGKISTKGADLGYWIGYKQVGKGSRRGCIRDLVAENEQYGFMVWLQNTLQKYHGDVKLVVMKTSAEVPFGYAWEGSPYERQCLFDGRLKSNLHEFRPQMETSL